MLQTVVECLSTVCCKVCFHWLSWLWFKYLIFLAWLDNGRQAESWL